MLSSVAVLILAAPVYQVVDLTDPWSEFIPQDLNENGMSAGFYRPWSPDPMPQTSGAWLFLNDQPVGGGHQLAFISMNSKNEVLFQANPGDYFVFRQADGTLLYSWDWGIPGLPPGYVPDPAPAPIPVDFSTLTLLGLSPTAELRGVVDQNTRGQLLVAGTEKVFSQGAGLWYDVPHAFLLTPVEGGQGGGGQVPEPATAVLVAIGAVALWSRRRKA